MSNQTYVADCHKCKHHWVTRMGFGAADYCPKCRSPKISQKPTNS